MDVNASHECPGNGHFPVERDSFGWHIDTCGDGAIDSIIFCPYCGVKLEQATEKR